MCQPHHLCFILSVILCINAAYDDCDDNNLNPIIRNGLRDVLKGKKARYDCKLENEVADDLIFYKRYGFGSPKNVKEILKFVKKMEVGYKVKYFTSQKKMFDYVKHVKGKNVGCVQLLHICSHLVHYYQGYICLIEKSSFWWWFGNF
ncbi:unnamed protein product [Cylicocyclus nassatus]|uniref:Uncharacterized protein n=1 Tax=Cylicocyclus nassatus TaxID=53992 RepID=A0AA36DQR9_CYLNA|nr:unnamed protein product [Cylicocyclus nassatus]